MTTCVFYKSDKFQSIECLCYSITTKLQQLQDNNRMIVSENFWIERFWKIQGNDLIVYIRICNCVNKSATGNRVLIREEKEICKKKKIQSEETSSPKVKKFFGFANKWTHVFVVNTKSNETFFRCKVCFQAYIFIDSNDQLNASREEYELEITKTAEWVGMSF